MEKKPYFFCMTICHQYTKERIGRRCGVVMAASQQEAETIAWERYGNAFSTQFWVQEVIGDGIDYTVYKNEI